MLWIAVTLPDLPLEAVRPPRLSATEVAPCMALVDHQQILQVDAAAAACGIRVGMSRAHAQALAPELRWLLPDVARQQAVLAELALALLRYTPRVVLAEAHTVLLEVSASLRLFGGLRALWRRLEGSLLPFGYRYVLACAPTAWGSWLLAQARALHERAARRSRVLQLATLEWRLARLPLTLLPAASAHLAALQQLGCNTLGGLQSLPPGGVTRRFGAALLKQLAQAYGHAPDLRNWFCAPARFEARLELQARVAHNEALVFAARRLLVQLAGWLTARQAAVRAYTLHLVHETTRSGAPHSSSLAVAWSMPSRDAEHLAWLLRETFNHTQLAAPVLELYLVAGQVEAYTPVSDTLFPMPATTPQALAELLDRLTARLGREQVVQLVPQADHRPERALSQQPAAARNPVRRRAVPASRAGDEVNGALRPAWLLEVPQALALRAGAPVLRGALQLLDGPERIETGWWDSTGAVRDYFVARDARGCLCWIYRECRSGQWFLQGWFA